MSGLHFNKEKVLNILEGILDKSQIVNINNFSNEIIIDVIPSNPTHKSKTEISNKIVDFLRKEYSPDFNYKIEFKPMPKSIESSENHLPNIKNIIAISSAKGGVGKSTITSNIAVTLCDMGFKVGILDADIYGPSMHIMFGIDSEKPSAVTINNKSKMQPIISHGVKVASIGFFVQKQEAVVWRGPMASKALNQLLWDTHWGELDYLIVDLPPGTGDIHLSLVQSIPLDGAIVVSTPQSIALADAEKGINMFQKESINVPVLGIIENMSYFIASEKPEEKHFIFGKDGAKGLAEKMDINLLAEIPIEQSIREAADAGRPVVLQNNTVTSERFLELARKIIIVVQKRNIHLPKTKVVKITHNKGCS